MSHVTCSILAAASRVVEHIGRNHLLGLELELFAFVLLIEHCWGHTTKNKLIK